MKKETYKRKIKPKKGSRAKTREGILTVIKRRAETAEDVDEILDGAQPNPERDLKNMADDAELILANVPRGKSGLMQIEEASPEHYAQITRKASLVAINYLAEGNTMLAVRYSLMASRNYWLMIFTEEWEPQLARAVNQIPKGPKDKRKRWAVELADFLLSQGHKKFSPAWESIPETWESVADGGILFDGYNVSRDDDAVFASSDTKEDSLAKVSFRTHYFSKQKNKK